MKARATATERMARLVRRLTARDLKMRLERLLMNLAASGGLRAVDRAIAVLNARDRRLRLVGKHRVGRKWREELTAGRALEVDVITFVALQVVGLHLLPEHRAVAAEARRLPRLGTAQRADS